MWIGTSGWSYPNWQGPFYPPGLKPGQWLAHYARHLATVELNMSFYRLPTAAAVARWAALTPEGFLFALKAPRAVTHEHRLLGGDAALQAFLERTAALGAKRGPILVQLPPRFPADPSRLETFLQRLPPDARVAVECRDPSWWTDRVLDLLARHQAAFVAFDLAGSCSPRVATAGFVYARLHGHAERYRGPYPPDRLADWAGWLGARRDEGRDAHLYFDNTAEADDAVRDALRLRAMLAEAAPA